VLIHRCQRTHWTQAVRLTGATVVEFGTVEGTTPDDLTAAFTAHTAAVVYYPEHAPDQSLPLAEVSAVAHAHGVPVIVDAAALVPPLSNLAAFAEQGANVTLVSGGKLLGGPASTGLALGDPQLLQAMRVHSSPRFAVGRPMKVGKEDVAGLVRAVQLAVAACPEEQAQQWDAQARYIVSRIRVPAGMSSRYVRHGEDVVLPRVVPRVYIEWGPQLDGVTAEGIASRLLAREPAIAVGAWERRIALNPAVLKDDDLDTLVDGVNHVLAEVSGP
jgi:L-seryl-tRNA(Ser) seleniumtransferase